MAMACSSSSRRSGGRRSKSCTGQEQAQAAYLQDRGDLRRSLFQFEAEVPCPSVRGRRTLSNVGLEVCVGPSNTLRVAKVAEMQKGVLTPLALWNSQQEKQQQRHLAVKPGDVLHTVNGSIKGPDAILSPLKLGKKATRLSFVRELQDTLVPQGAPVHPPALRPSVEEKAREERSWASGALEKRSVQLPKLTQKDLGGESRCCSSQSGTETRSTYLPSAASSRRPSKYSSDDDYEVLSEGGSTGQ